MTPEHKAKLLAANLVHGKTGTPAFQTWKEMFRRCTNKRCKAYPNYGGRGIKICDRWNQFANFLQDMGERPAGMSLDRIDNNGNYEPGNCRWASRSQQNNNCRRNRIVEFRSRRVSLAEACREANMPYYLVRDRIVVLRWPVDRALTEEKQ